MTRDFEDHCWRDIVSDEILSVYEPYHRDVFVGERPALLAIDLYNLVYRGGAKEPHEIIADYPSTCGRYSWEAVEPTKALSPPREKPVSQCFIRPRRRHRTCWRPIVRRDLEVVMRITKFLMHLRRRKATS